jgi:hypothetical protein
MNLAREFRNFIGKLRGFGACMHCGDRWNWKPEHTTWCFADRGMFPLCERCFQKLPITQVYDYHLRLWRQWEEQIGRLALTVEQKKKIMARIVKDRATLKPTINLGAHETLIVSIHEKETIS